MYVCVCAYAYNWKVSPLIFEFILVFNTILIIVADIYGRLYDFISIKIIAAMRRLFSVLDFPLDLLIAVYLIKPRLKCIYSTTVRSANNTKRHCV